MRILHYSEERGELPFEFFTFFTVGMMG